jgi:hypothetical protein
LGWCTERSKGDDRFTNRIIWEQVAMKKEKYREREESRSVVEDWRDKRVEAI